MLSICKVNVEALEGGNMCGVEGMKEKGECSYSLIKYIKI